MLPRKRDLETHGKQGATPRPWPAPSAPPQRGQHLDSCRSRGRRSRRLESPSLNASANARPSLRRLNFSTQSVPSRIQCIDNAPNKKAPERGCCFFEKLTETALSIYSAAPQPKRTTDRRFPPPWTVEEQDACFVVRDHSGQQLAYIYISRMRRAGDRRPSCSPKTRRAGLRSISRSCRIYCWTLKAAHDCRITLRLVS
jgi:hypothetical protein